MRKGIVIVALALLGLTREAAACGYCVEDKIASTYDHAMITRALAQKHHVVFFHLEGTVPSSAASIRAIERTVRSTPGVDPGSARFAPETATLAVAFDPTRDSLVGLQGLLEKKLAAYRISLMPLRIMERPADLRTVKR